jgi:transposase InsO family protein
VGKSKEQRRYTPEERERALALAETSGVAGAGKELGIPRGTVSCWRTMARRVAKAARGAVATVATAAVTALASRKEAPEASKPAKVVARLYTPSQRAQVLEHAAKHGVTKASAQFKVSRFSIYEWRRQVRLAGQGEGEKNPVGGEDTDLAAFRDRRILEEWRSQPGLGPSQIRNQLRRQGMKVSVHTVRRVMEENGYVPPKIRRVTAHDHEYEAIRPNQLWHLDFVSRYIHKLKVFILLIVDDYSRFIVGGGIFDAERGEAVMSTFENAVSRHGRPEAAMSDGGSAFYAWHGISRFTRLLEELEVDQIVVETPEANGKLEVLNANVQKELFNQEKFFDVTQAQSRLQAWIAFYNFRRTHHALGGLLVPADRYFGRADEVLGQIEAGRPAQEVGEPIPVSERQLDVLRVTSVKGEVAVTLMGRQIWPVSAK